MHSISAYATEADVVLMQEISKSKENEVGTVLEIIDKLEIKDTIITADAMSYLKKVTFATRLWRLENTHRRFCRWRDKGIWEELLEQLIDESDYEWCLID